MFIFFLIYLSLINYYLKKNEIFIDKASIIESHKLLLNTKDDKIPLSGFFYFVPIIFIILFNDNFLRAIFTDISLCIFK